ncbi:class I SAM-dependent methyltransferase [Urbifossiella limnaea]|uniref:Ubiquinone biosynthesis O-methyltransferase n=1 Tax=Urbifossiella limnaea TaxID=2528023 RepID=A0A517Y3B9_9BACT|nr:class I SAM-dependent methyltransferase [Urbifossiella limnaea]QDU24303.1 Ubiquinone biosynthesis O-methyltransferase [Urbifossiella limnaea]
MSVADHPGCLYCGGRDLDVLYTGVTDRLGHVPGERTFLRCRGCGSAVLDPLPRTEELPGFYPGVYSFGGDLGSGSRLKRLLSTAEYRAFVRPAYTAQVRKVVRACGWRRGEGRRLLDVGCGRGLRLLEFRARGFEVAGLDVLPDVVRYVRDDLGVPARCADAAAAADEYEPGAFDLVTSFFLIEHVPDVRAALAGMFRVLKPGGWVAGAVPFTDCVQAGVFGRRWIHTAEAPRHLSLPSRAGLATAFREAGFEGFRIVPDSALHCGGQVGSSLVPGATITHAYGGRGLGPLARRALGAAVTFAAVPWCAFENHVLGRPSMGIAVARKPGAS